VISRGPTTLPWNLRACAPCKAATTPVKFSAALHSDRSRARLSCGLPFTKASREDGHEAPIGAFLPEQRSHSIAPPNPTRVPRVRDGGETYYLT